MKILNKILYSLIALTILIITGCGTNQQKYFLSSNNITVERVESKRSRIGMVYVTEANEGIEIRGEIRRRSNSRGPIPGHMDIELIRYDGQSISKSYAKYSRRNHKAKTAKFKLKLDAAPKENYIIRVAHHYPMSSGYICCHVTTEGEK